MVKNLSCVSCAAWNVFPINSLLTSLHLVCALQHFLIAPGLLQCPQFFWFSEDSIIDVESKLFFQLLFWRNSTIDWLNSIWQIFSTITFCNIDLLRFHRFFPRLLFVILTQSRVRAFSRFFWKKRNLRRVFTNFSKNNLHLQVV